MPKSITNKTSKDQKTETTATEKNKTKENNVETVDKPKQSSNLSMPVR